MGVYSIAALFLISFSYWNVFPVLGIFVFSAVVLLPLLIPIAVTDDGIKNANMNNTQSVGTFSELDNLSMGNINVSNINVLFDKDFVNHVFFL